uniref:Uncharacterized protein n=1 Tax=Ailuropoda melanoleuca TaxID=9646 RepID=A0A7N5K012_AILME
SECSERWTWDLNPLLLTLVHRGHGSLRFRGSLPRWGSATVPAPCGTGAGWPGRPLDYAISPSWPVNLYLLQPACAWSNYGCLHSGLLTAAKRSIACLRGTWAGEGVSSHQHEVGWGLPEAKDWAQGSWMGMLVAGGGLPSSAAGLPRHSLVPR